GGDSEANALNAAVKAYSNPTGGRSWILPIAFPFPVPGPSSTYAAGHNDGNYVTGKIANSISSELHIPGSNALMVYLDVECCPGESISVAFYQGWGDAVNSLSYADACVYMNPGDSTDVDNMNDSGRYFQGWSPVPTAVNCTYCQSPGPSWGPTGIS